MREPWCASHRRLRPRYPWSDLLIKVTNDWLSKGMYTGRKVRLKSPSGFEACLSLWNPQGTHGVARLWCIPTNARERESAEHRQHSNSLSHQQPCSAWNPCLPIHCTIGWWGGCIECGLWGKCRNSPNGTSFGAEIREKSKSRCICWQGSLKSWWTRIYGRMHRLKILSCFLKRKEEN